MLCQSRSCIASQTVCQLKWFLRKISHQYTSFEQLEPSKWPPTQKVTWVTYDAATATHARSGTSVIRRSSVPSRARAGTTTNWSQPDTVAKSKATTQWRFVVLEPNHSYDCHSNHPQTGKRHGHPQPARLLLMLVNGQKSEYWILTLLYRVSYSITLTAVNGMNILYQLTHSGHMRRDLTQLIILLESTH